MGSFPSKDKAHILPSDRLQLYSKEYKPLNFNESTICLLYNEFRKIDLYDEGGVEIDVLLKYYCIPVNEFTKNLFLSKDIDIMPSNDVDFAKYAQGLWNFCTLDNPMLCHCIFSLYDEEQDGYLSKKELLTLITNLHENVPDDEDLEKAKKEISDSRIRNFDPEHFEDLCQKHRAILQPVFDIRKNLRQTILGYRFWNPLITFRRNLVLKLDAEVDYIPVRIILAYQTDNTAVRRYLEKREVHNALQIATMRSRNNLAQRRGIETMNRNSSTNGSDGHSDRSHSPLSWLRQSTEPYRVDGRALSPVGSRDTDEDGKVPEDAPEHNSNALESGKGPISLETTESERSQEGRVGAIISSIKEQMQSLLGTERGKSPGQKLRQINSIKINVQTIIPPTL